MWGQLRFLYFHFFSHLLNHAVHQIRYFHSKFILMIRNDIRYCFFIFFTYIEVIV